MTLATDTLATLLALIQTEHHLDVSGVTTQSSLADVGLDSLAVAELIFSIEDAFKINLGEVAPDSMPATVGDVVAMIDAHR